MPDFIKQAVILAAGQGLRLRKNERDYLKPLYPFHGMPLISHIMERFVSNGINKFFAVVGFEKEQLIPAFKNALPRGAELIFINNPDWQMSNGISLLKAKSHVSGRFFLSMSDHIFQPEMIKTLSNNAILEDCLYLAVDKKLDTIFDMEDATKVRLNGSRILDISKKLEKFDAVDTGLFVCPPEIFDYLDHARIIGDCTLSDGVRGMAKEGKALAVDIGNAIWQDIDTPEMLSHAESLPF